MVYVLRNFLVCFLACFSVMGQDVIQVAPEREQALKERVSKFWDGFVTAKYRQSDAYVSEDAKEEFFSWPKKKIRGYAIDRIYYADKGNAAKVLTLVDTTLSMMGIGAMDIKQPVETWWKEENGQWFWFIPKNEVRMTPFGQMESNTGSGTAALNPTGQMNPIPTQKELAEMMARVKPDREEVRFSLGEAKVETVTFSNGMPGTITLTLNAPLMPHVTAELSSRDVPRGGTASLILKYEPKGKDAQIDDGIAKTVSVGVAQTGRVYPIKVVIDLKKK